MSFLEIKNISKSFKNNQVLENVSFSMDEGEIVSIVGPSGAGKTTLLRIITGLEDFDNGEILVNDMPIINKKPSEREMAIIFQDGALFPHIKVKDNITYGLTKLGYDKQSIDSMCLDICKRFHIDHIMGRYPNNLSAGEIQRVGIARAIIRNPKILLLDEPFSNLDMRLKDELHSELLKIHEDMNITMILVTHDQDEAMTFSNRIILLNEGHIISDKSIKDLYYNPINVFEAEFFGNPRINIFKVKDFKDSVDKQLSEDCLIGVRPEDITISEDGNIAGIVEQCLMNNERFILFVRVDENIIRIISEKEYKTGDLVKFSFTDRIHIFNS